MSLPRENNLYGLRIFHEARQNIIGMTELPADFVAFKGDQLVIAGEPSKDVLQLAFSEIGFVRANVHYWPRAERREGALSLVA